MPPNAQIREQIIAISRIVETNLIDAEARAAELASRYPDDFDAQMLHGYTLSRQRDNMGAIRCLEIAIRLRPDSDAAHFNLATTYCQFGDYDRAFDHFKAASETAPAGNHEALVMSAMCLHRQGHPGEAVPIYRQVIEAQSADASALFGLVQALRETGAFVEADLWADRLSNMLQGNYQSVCGLLNWLQTYDYDGWLEVDDKVKLTRHINAFRQDVDENAFPTMPATFIMPEDYSALERSHAESPRIWIEKPNNMHNGHGIRLLGSPDRVNCKSGWLVQEYLPEPFLFRGRKASFRLNMLVTSSAPPRVYLFHGGSVRFALDDYTGALDNLDHLASHIGHYAIFSDQKALVNKTAELMDSPNSVWQFDRMIAYIRDAGLDTDRLWTELETMAREVVQLFQHISLFKRQTAHNLQFAYGPKILGLDIFLDAELRPWLLEIERGPTFFRMFNGERENNPVFQHVTDMNIFPIGENIRSATDAITRIETIESNRRGEFIPLLPQVV